MKSSAASRCGAPRSNAIGSTALMVPPRGVTKTSLARRRDAEPRERIRVVEHAVTADDVAEPRSALVPIFLAGETLRDDRVGEPLRVFAPHPRRHEAARQRLLREIVAAAAEKQIDA